MKWFIKLFILIFRIWNCQFVISYYSPDEYWQSIEVAHNNIYTHNQLENTWEWHSNIRLRSGVIIFMYSILYKLLYILNIPRYLVIIAPRILQAFILYYTDIIFIKLILKFSSIHQYWTILLYYSNWFLFYASIRTLNNSFEMIIMIITLYYYMLVRQMNSNVNSKKNINIKKSIFGFWLLVGVIIRPTFIIPWLCIIFMDNIIHFINFIKYILLICFITLCLDTIYYKQLTFTPFQFFWYNTVLNISNLYGQHSWYWYFIIGWSQLLNMMLPLWIYGLIITLKYRFMYILSIAILFTIFIFSLSSHKEERFLMHLIPLALIHVGIAIKYLFRNKRWKIYITYYLYCTVVLNIIISIYLSRFHQVAPLKLIKYIDHSQTKDVFFLMPCHAVPSYSQLINYKSIKLNFLECPPQVKVNNSWKSIMLFESFELYQYNNFSRNYTETGLFLSQPMHFVNEYFKHNHLPQYIALFECHQIILKSWFYKNNYKIINGNIHHSHLSDYKTVYIYKKNH